MSLLLDALKKAAEQKAEKSREDAPGGRPSDETVIDAGAEDVSRLEADGAAPRPDARDETELDNSELEVRYERTQVEREADDETGLDVADETAVREEDPSTQMQTGEDETIIFAAEDVSEFLGEPQFVSRETRAPDDETDLSQLAPQDEPTDVREVTPVQPGEDETDLSQLASPEDVSVTRQALDREDETDISEPLPPAAHIDRGEALQSSPGAEDTDLSRIGAAEDTDLSRVSPASSEDTDLSRVDAVEEDDTSTSTPQDMSLLLVDRDETGMTAPTSLTDPQSPSSMGDVPDTGDDSLALVDTTQHRPAPDQTSTTESATTQATAPQAADQTSSTATTGVALNTLTTEGATTRVDSTSTRTYAPDNYDRTLMKLPSEDASRLFAGMKSDSDVVMTPDYAKKVFRSKSSAQRTQHYKVYGGIVFIIALGVIIYGLFEYQEESFNIEASLRPLKRDPLPGVIQSGNRNQQTNLFGESGVDAKTIELIENAENMTDDAITDEAVIAGQDSGEVVSETETTTGSSGESLASETLSGNLSAAAAGGDSSTQADDGVFTSVAKLKPASEPTPSQTADKTSNLEIVSTNKVEEKNLWLRDAYSAYQAGNDSRALELYNRVLAVDPTNRNALLARAAIHVQNNNSAAAIEDYQTLLLANPKDSLAMTSLISVANISPRNTESQLKLMIRDEPDSPYLNFALANAYGAQNRWPEAQSHYFTALENNPDDPNYAYNLAVSLEHIAKPGVAISYYRRALENFNKGLATFSREVVNQRLEILGQL